MMNNTIPHLTKNKTWNQFDEQEFKTSMIAPRSNCALDTSKLKAAGIELQPVREALEDALNNYKLS